MHRKEKYYYYLGKSKFKNFQFEIVQLKVLEYSKKQIRQLMLEDRVRFITFR